MRWAIRLIPTAAAAVCLAFSAHAQETPALLPLVESPVRATDPTLIPEAQGVTPVAVVEGLEAPWSMVWLPNGDILVTELLGQLRVIRDGELRPRPVRGVPSVFAERQGGLLDVTIHPDFAENRWVYLSYAAGTEEANRLTVARGQLRGDTLRDVEVIFEVDQAKTGAQHFGSRFLWLPDGTLLLSVGDGGNPPRQLDGALIREQAQNLDSHLGKLIRITDAGGVPTDNPFLDRPDAQPALFSLGHRNIQGLAYDPLRDRIYATEHGSQGGDELNIIAAGANYGWPHVTHAVEYGPERTLITRYQTRPGMADPFAVWTPSIAPSGLMVYTGDVYPAWRGDLFVGALRVNRADNPGTLFRLDLDEAGAIVAQERITFGDHRIRDVRQGPDGYIYVLTASTQNYRDAGHRNGVLWRLEPRE